MDNCRVEDKEPEKMSLADVMGVLDGISGFAIKSRADDYKEYIGYGEICRIVVVFHTEEMADYIYHLIGKGGVEVEREELWPFGNKQLVISVPVAPEKIREKSRGYPERLVFEEAEANDV